MNKEKFIEDVLAPAIDRSVLSWPVVTSAAFTSIVIQLFGSPDLANTHLAFRALSAAAAIIPMFFVIAIFQLVPVRNIQVKIILRLSGYFIGGALRGWAVITFLEGLQLLQKGNIWFRVPTSAVIMSAEVAIATFASANLRKHRQTTRRLRSETEKLQGILGQLDRENNSSNLRKIQQISTDIAQQLRKIQLRTGQNHVLEIQRILQDYVRPLSKIHVPDSLQTQLNENQDTWRAIVQTWKEFDLLSNLPSIWWNIIGAMMPFPTAAHFYGLEIAVMHSLFIFVIITPGTYLHQKILRSSRLAQTFPAREICITLGYFLIATAASLGSYFALTGTQNPNYYSITTFLIYPLYSWAVTIGVALRAQVVEQEIGMRALRDQLAWALARVNLLDWFNQGLISRLLHGPIQNSLHAASIRIEGSNSQDDVQSVIDELRVRMNEIAPMAESESLMAPNITHSLSELAQLWSGVSEIAFTIDLEARLQLEQDPASAYITIDICQEICSNAIRHGSATKLAINISSTQRAVIISLHDDGQPNLREGEFGLGAQFLSTCSIDWQYRRESPTANYLEITIPTK